jgi:ArsR family transcriptional regulator
MDVLSATTDGPGGDGEVMTEPLAFEQAQQLMRALADPIRMRVIETLGDGERCVCELTSEFGMAQSKLSFHLRVLREAGLISARQQGRWMYYRLEPAALLRLRGWLDQLSEGCRAPAHPCT